jgi:hypothetical protein
VCPCTGFDPLEGAPAVRPGDFGRDVWASPDHAFAQRRFLENGRFFDLMAVFGSSRASQDEVDRANAVLQTLRIDPDGPGAPETVPGAGEPPAFRRANGWQTIDQGFAVGVDSAPLAWASNVPIDGVDLSDSARDETLSGWPRHTLEALPADGIVMTAWIYGPSKSGPGKETPDRTLPLQLSDAQIQHGWEGQVAPNVPLYLIAGNAQGWNIQVDVFFGTQDPSEATRSAAQEELNRLSLPEQTSQTIEVPGADNGWTTHIDAGDRVAIDAPDAWTFNDDPTPGLLSPPILFAVGTGPVPSDPYVGDACAPQSAISALPQDGALAWLTETEYGDMNQIQASAFPDRPESFRLDPATRGSYECSGVPSYLIRFREDRRYFQFQVAFGRDASDALRQDVLRALDTFAPVPDGTCIQAAQLGGRGAHEPAFSASSGAPGDTVVASGWLPFPPRGEGGQHVSKDGERVEVWWNDGGSGFRDAVPSNGPATSLGGQDVRMTCSYSVDFTIPNDPPGVYPLTVRDVGHGGYSWLGEANFTVTG